MNFHVSVILFSPTEWPYYRKGLVCISPLWTLTPMGSWIAFFPAPPIKVPFAHRTVLCPSSGLRRLYLLLLQGDSSGVQHHGKGKRGGRFTWSNVVMNDLDRRTISLATRSSFWEDFCQKLVAMSTVLPQSPVSFCRTILDPREPLTCFYWKCNDRGLFGWFHTEFQVSWDVVSRYTHCWFFSSLFNSVFFMEGA